MTEELRWRRASSTRWDAVDGAMRYSARLIKVYWRVTMNGVVVGPKGGFANLEAAKHYVDWGGTPNRMGHDRETGELFGD